MSEWYKPVEGKVFNGSVEGVKDLPSTVGKAVSGLCESLQVCMRQLEDSTDAISSVSIELLQTMSQAVVSAETASEVAVENADKFLALCIELDSQMHSVSTLQSKLYSFELNVMS
jgi:phage tail tape-measure protein